MIIITNYWFDENTLFNLVYVRSREQSYCSCCGEHLGVIGSRKRKYIKMTGERVILIIRRLKCKPCKRIHHELPDKLVPYKRYSSKSIEEALSCKNNLTVAADESTISRWRKWFRDLALYLLGCLISICYTESAAEAKPELPGSPLQRIWHYVGDAPRWLSRVVRPLANKNLWVHTRSAFLSG